MMLAQEQATRAQVDRLRRRHLRQTEAVSARPDGDHPGTGGRSIRRCTQETRHSRRPKGRASQERIAHENTGAKERKIESFKENEIITIECSPPQPIFFRPFLNRDPLPTSNLPALPIAAPC